LEVLIKINKKETLFVESIERQIESKKSLVLELDGIID